MSSTVVVAELLAALSLSTDLAAGVPPETSLRTSLLAVRLADKLGLDGAARAEVFHVALLRHLGCTSWASEAARLGEGDDQHMMRLFEDLDADRTLARLGRAARRMSKRGTVAGRVSAVARMLANPSAPTQVASAQCDQAIAFAGDLELPAAVGTGLGQIYERHDGRGRPKGVRGDALTLAARLLHTAQVVEIAFRHGGRDAAAAELAARRGRHLDPAIVDVAVAELDACVPLLAATSVWERRAEGLPASPESPDAALDRAARAFGRYADLKSAFTIGHSTVVAALAEAAGRHAELPAAELAELRRAALLHDLGVVSVATGIWDAPAKLGVAAWEQVRLHAYWSERILHLAPCTAPLALIAGAHHERADGGGYPRASRGPFSLAARILAAADAFAAMREVRAHRAPVSADIAAERLREDVRAGRLSADACAHVLAAAGQAPPAPRPRPAGLTDRELEVLIQIAHGSSAKEIAAALGIAVRTVKHHIEHIYEKTEVSTRAAAALFAARHDLVRIDDEPA